MEIKGKVIAIPELQEGTSRAGNAWRKQRCVINTEGQYAKDVVFYMFGDKIVDLKLGQYITAQIEIESREWEGKWFTDVRAWKVEIDDRQAQQAPANDVTPMDEPGDEDDNLPF